MPPAYYQKNLGRLIFVICLLTKDFLLHHPTYDNYKTKPNKIVLMLN